MRLLSAASGLNKVYIATSYNVDRKGQPFVSTIEGMCYTMNEEGRVFSVICGWLIDIMRQVSSTHSMVFSGILKRASTSGIGSNI